MSGYLTVDIAQCRAAGHQLKTVWSDKTPLKVNLLCLNCTEATRQSAYAAFGEDTQSWGAWRKRRKDRHEEAGHGEEE